MTLLRHGFAGRVRPLVLAALLTSCGPSPIIGTPYVVDGDTLRVDGRLIRLAGIDAPEMSTIAGQKARDHMKTLLGWKSVVCRDSEQRSYGRVVARCSSQYESDLGEAMVRDGWAVDLQRYSGGKYHPIEIEARREKRGMWKTS